MNDFKDFKIDVNALVNTTHFVDSILHTSLEILKTGERFGKKEFDNNKYSCFDLYVYFLQKFSELQKLDLYDNKKVNKTFLYANGEDIENFLISCGMFLIDMRYRLNYLDGKINDYLGCIYKDTNYIAHSSLRNVICQEIQQKIKEFEKVSIYYTVYDLLNNLNCSIRIIQRSVCMFYEINEQNTQNTDYLISIHPACRSSLNNNLKDIIVNLVLFLKRNNFFDTD